MQDPTPVTIHNATVEVQQVPGAQPRSWDLSEWSPSDWAAWGGLALSLVIAVAACARALYVWRRDRLTLRLEPIEIPGRKPHATEECRLDIHFDRGPSFRVQKVLLLLRSRDPNDNERSRYESMYPTPSQQKSLNPLMFPPTIPFQLSGINNGNTHTPLFNSGETLRCDTQVSAGFPWELIVPEASFAHIEVYSLGKVVMRWDVSDHFRKCLWHFVDWRRGNGQLVRDYSAAELEGLTG